MHGCRAVVSLARDSVVRILSYEFYVKFGFVGRGLVRSIYSGPRRLVGSGSYRPPIPPSRRSAVSIQSFISFSPHHLPSLLSPTYVFTSHIHTQQEVDFPVPMWMPGAPPASDLPC